MEQVLPLQLKGPFKCQIIQASESYKHQNTTFYDCTTNFGHMTLIMEEIYSGSTQKLHIQIDTQKQNISDPLDILKKRNQFLASLPVSKYIPVIYEQYILTTHKDRSTCLTLIEPITLLDFSQIQNNISIEKEKQLILALYAGQGNESKFKFRLNQQHLKRSVFFKSKITNKIHLNFTQLAFNSSTNSKLHQKTDQVSTFLQIFQLNETSKALQFEKLDEIILIKDKLYRSSRQKIIEKKPLSWFQAALCFNFLVQEQFFVKTKQKNINGEFEQKIKKLPLKSLCHNQSGVVQIISSNDANTIMKLNFYDGYCINFLQPIQYEELLKNFFIDQSTYVLKKDIYLEVQRLNQKSYIGVKKDKYRGDIILIEEGVAKYECINFFITYCKFVEPLLKKISFQKDQNALIFEFLGKFKVQRKLKLVFCRDYIIKDEQLSMIIEKSKLDDLVLKLSEMQISDSFLMFLANSQKMKKIKELDISYCKKVTQNGVNSLLISPFCKSLQILNVSGTPVIQSSIQSLSSKTNLQELYLNNCQRTQQVREDVFMLKNMKLLRLEAIGINIQPTFSQSVEYLKIDIEIPVDYLKELRDMPLKQLTIKIVQGKKNLIGGFLGNFYLKDVNPVKVFAQGKASKTLTKLDLSGSLAKLKSIKNILNMPELQSLIIDNLTPSQQIDFHINPRILMFSLRNSCITLTDLRYLLKQTKILMRLDISNTEIRKKQISDFLAQSKKYINTLVISQNQYTEHLIDVNGKASEFVQTFQLSTTQQFFKLKNQSIIANMIMKIMKGNKNLKFVYNGQISHKSRNQVRKFENTVLKVLSKFYGSSNMENLRTIFINDKSYKDCYEQFSMRRKSDQKINCEQFLRVYNKDKRPTTFYLRKDSDHFRGCLISKKTIQSKNHKVTNQDYSELTMFTYLFKKCIISYPQSFLQVSLFGNKIINCCDALKLMTQYGSQQKIRAIDMREATLITSQNHSRHKKQSSELFFSIIELPFLESFNHNQYQLILDQRNFIQMSQKYLKFFMRIAHVRKFKLKCINILEVDILFSILYHILDYHFETIEVLDVTFENIKMSRENSSSFWSKISDLKRLKELSMRFISLSNVQHTVQNSFLRKIFQQHPINSYRHLEQLNIEGMHFQNIPLTQNGQTVKNLNINLQNSMINQMQLIKLLKPYNTGIRSINLCLDSCPSIIYPNKLFASFNNFVNVQKLIVSFEYCPIKELSTLDFLENIFILKSLKQVELNFSFTCITFGSISNIIANFPVKLPNCHLLVYLIGNQSKQVVFDKQGLLYQGVQIVL